MSIAAPDAIPIHTDTDLDAREREAQVLGKPPRIAAMCEEEYDAEARALVDELHQSLDVGERTPSSDFFRTMLRHPGLFRCQMRVGIQLLGKGILDPRHRELAILRIACLCRAPFEWGEHVRIGKICGLTPEDIQRVIEGSSAAGWDEIERAIMRGVEELFRDQMVADDTWSILAQHWTEPQLIEFVVVAGQYVATAYLQNSLRIRLAPGSGGLRQR
jgi:4-carboxymuconolactone decarboxylase